MQVKRIEALSEKSYDPNKINSDIESIISKIKENGENIPAVLDLSRSERKTHKKIGEVNLGLIKFDKYGWVNDNTLHVTLDYSGSRDVFSACKDLKQIGDLGGFGIGWDVNAYLRLNNFSDEWSVIINFYPENSLISGQNNIFIAQIMGIKDGKEKDDLLKIPGVEMSEPKYESGFNAYYTVSYTGGKIGGKRSLDDSITEFTKETQGDLIEKDAMDFFNLVDSIHLKHNSSKNSRRVHSLDLQAGSTNKRLARPIYENYDEPIISFRIKTIISDNVYLEGCDEPKTMCVTLDYCI